MYCLIFVGNVAIEKSRLECKIWHSTLVCILLYHERIIYIHFTSPKISKVCIHLGIHKHLMSNGTCSESLDKFYQCAAYEVIKPSTTKNYVVGIATSKQFLANYLLKSPSNSKRHHLASSSLSVSINSMVSPKAKYLSSKCL